MAEPKEKMPCPEVRLGGGDGRAGVICVLQVEMPPCSCQTASLLMLLGKEITDPKKIKTADCCSRPPKPW